MIATAELTPTREIAGATLLNLLVIDDDRAIRECCRDTAQVAGFNTYIADSSEHAIRIMEQQAVDIVLLDLRLPGANGLEALKAIKSRRPNAVVIVMTGFATVPSAVQAMKLGAFDYISKPFTLDELRVMLERGIEELRLTTEKRVLRERLRSRHGFGSIVGRAPDMEKLYRIIAKAAQSTHPVLICGETGSGKELVARSIHYSGPCHDKPFIPVDCGSVSPALMESELFGYVRGAFAGAVRAKDGLLTIASGGTVFLDEVSELSTDLQAKLLRAIQEKEIRPVGSNKRMAIDVRILAATNRDLEVAVAEGTFRRDLYFRLNVLTLKVPPLRERKQDLPLLVEHFLERMARTSGVSRTFSADAMRALEEYDWPGNVRELENCLDRACALSSGPTIQTADLPSPVQNVHHHIPPAAKDGPRITRLAEVEKQVILRTIDQLKGDKLLAARLLGIGKTTLYRKLKEYASED
jgi:DNA-binding NtrC family response regulator